MLVGSNDSAVALAMLTPTNANAFVQNANVSLEKRQLIEAKKGKQEQTPHTKKIIFSLKNAYGVAEKMLL